MLEGRGEVVGVVGPEVEQTGHDHRAEDWALRDETALGPEEAEVEEGVVDDNGHSRHDAAQGTEIVAGGLQIDDPRDAPGLDGERADVPEARVQGVLAVGFHVEEHPVFAGEVLGYLVETISGRDQSVSGFSLFSDGSDGCFQLHM